MTQAPHPHTEALNKIRAVTGKILTGELHTIYEREIASRIDTIASAALTGSPGPSWPADRITGHLRVLANLIGHDLVPLVPGAGQDRSIGMREQDIAS